MNKRFFYIAIVALFVSLGTQAQSEGKYRAVEEAFAKTLHKYTAHVADTMAEHLIKKHKNDPELCVALARGYFRDREIKRSHEYLEKALKLKPGYGSAYTAYGDIEKYYLRPDSAVYYYEKAIKGDPAYTKSYPKYAEIVGKTDPEKAVAALQSARQYDKSFPADALSANVWFSAEGIGNETQLQKTIEYFEKADSMRMTKYDLGNYALAQWMSQNYNRSLEICNYGLERFPGFLTLARVKFYDQMGRKDYDAAFEAVDYLFNKCDSVDEKSFISRDYLNYASLYLTRDDMMNAALQIKKLYSCNDDDAMDMREASNQLVRAHIKGMEIDGRWNDAEQAWKTFIQYGRPQDLDNSYYYYMLTETYREHIQAIDSDMEIADKAAETRRVADILDAAYVDLQKRYPEFETELIAYLRAANMRQFEDDQFTQGVAFPYYQAIIDLVEPMPEKTSRQLQYLMGSYDYMAIYHFFRDDYARAATFAKRVLNIDASNSNALRIIELAEKASKKVKKGKK